MRRFAIFVWVISGLVVYPPIVVAQPTSSYYVYVCAESDDEVSVVRYGPSGLDVVKTISVGRYPAETEGPHGVNVDPDGRFWYVSVAHGAPFGSVHKYETGTDRWVADETLGMFPATLDVSSSTGLLYVVNFDLHGPMEPGTLSIVEVETMTEIERVPTGVMPHGSRLSADGTRHYSVSMMSDELVEVDALTFDVNRTLSLSRHGTNQSEDDASSHDPSQLVQPTWVTAPSAGGKLYVTGSAANEIYEVDVDEWKVTRTFETGPGPYNLDVTPDGATLVVTHKKGASVGFWDLETGRERIRVDTTRTIPHGVVLTPDGRYAFVTLEGVGSEPGTVEVYDVEFGRRVAAVDVGKQAGGIAFWKTE
jgi:DNA-binding beta-propeller fold protein YncE